jgi:magnesium-transporting ATPase (P-type)
MICATTLGFVGAIEPAEEGIMEQPPRRVGKRLIGRFLLLRIALATTVLVFVIVQPVFWAKKNGYIQEEIHGLALNSLNFGAISVTVSARFARKSALHFRTFQGNPLAWWSYAIIVVLQVFITNTPGLNTTVFSMKPLDWPQWIVVGIGMVVVLIVMEAEKAIAELLRSYKYMPDETEYGPFDSPPKPDTTPLPAEVNRFGLAEQEK